MKILPVLLALAATAMFPAAAAADGAPVLHKGTDRTISANGLTFSYRISGSDAGRPLLLLAGTGMQLIEWPPELIDGLVGQGYRVISYDHRDAGGSTHFNRSGPPDWPAIMAALGAGRSPPLPYDAVDMARDAGALLDALDIERADLLGISGGATIAALVAAEQPERVRSLHLIAANSGNPAIPMPADPARLATVAQPAPGDSLEDLVAKRVAMARALAAEGAPFDEQRMRALAQQAITRDPDPHGHARQGAAILSAGDLRARLATIEAPTLVVHGEEDPLVSQRAGRDVAATIPNATFLLVSGMGHELQPTHISAILEAVRANAARSR